LVDGQQIANLVSDIAPDEIYNLGAQSHVKVSFDNPLYTVDVVANGTLRVLEAARRLNDHKPVRVYQASSSEMYGAAIETPQSETTPFRPRSPYGCAKVYAFHQTVNYRQAYGLFACNGILFNHESPRRGEAFVTRKITRAVGRIKAGLQDKLFLGNLDPQRDWGYAPDYVDAMWRMLQHDQAEDFVIATGETHSIQDFLDLAFRRVELDWHQYVEKDSRYFRPSEVDRLIGDYSKAKRLLDWEPTTKFQQLVELMVDADVELAQAEAGR
jgi:GDPmannose 4,6-dehydratase